MTNKHHVQLVSREILKTTLLPLPASPWLKLQNTTTSQSAGAGEHTELLERSHTLLVDSELGSYFILECSWQHYRQTSEMLWVQFRATTKKQILQLCGSHKFWGFSVRI